MIAFLKALAAAYASRYEDMSGLLFLFPNKRSGTFFLKHLCDVVSGRRPRIAPRVMTISDFVSSVGRRDIAPRIDQIFRLYRHYCGICEARGAEPVEFDRFRGIGDVVLSDFSEVDQYGVDPEAVFGNVEDFREISTDFLTDEQKDVIEEYFGRKVSADAVGRFWKNFEGNCRSASKDRYLYLWQMLLPLYNELTASLDEQGLTTQGGAYRHAAMRLSELGREALPDCRKVVVAGFNALSVMEMRIFRELESLRDDSGEPFADFFWDGTGPVLSPDSVLSEGVASASRFISINRKMFPSPPWAGQAMAPASTDSFPAYIETVASPGNSQQAKIAGEIVERLRQELPPAEFASARVAVVLPDEGLLLPLLYALPADDGRGGGGVNLTMGYKLRLTSAMTFVRLLLDCHFSHRDSGGETGYYHEPVRQLLAHPFCHKIVGSKPIADIISFLNNHHVYAVTLSMLREFSSEAADLLAPFGDNDPPQATIERLDAVMKLVEERLESDGSMIKGDLDREHIAVYREALRRLGEALEDYGISMRPSTVFSMTDRLLAGETVTFEGEPLNGLQVMGLLETRSLDFDYIVVCSLNERVVPMRRRKRTFIPDAIRCGFGMPPSGYEESIFSYYFYRMISRARRVWLIYDARASSGMRSGGVSRYILQLRHLAGLGLLGQTHFRETEYTYRISSGSGRKSDVHKTEDIRRRLEDFTRNGSGCRLSASALRTYMKCQARFYYENVLKIRTDRQPSEYIDAITHGDVLHGLMMNLYLPSEKREVFLENPVIVTAEMLDSISADAGRIRKETVRLINRHHFHFPEDRLDTPLTGAADMVADMIVRQAGIIIDRDRSLAPFELYGCEIRHTMQFPVGGRNVNMTYAIDRLDRISVGGRKVLRIVDYKTGRVHLTADDIDGVFSGDYKADNIFQLMLYSRLLTESGYRLPENEAETGIRMEIYDVTKLGSGKESLPEIGGETVHGHLVTSRDFDRRLECMISEIFESPVFKSVDEDGCSLCLLRQLCGK